MFLHNENSERNANYFVTTKVTKIKKVLPRQSQTGQFSLLIFLK